MNTDPLLRIEVLLEELQKKSGAYAQPVRKRYPILFAFLLTFSVAAILHGFELYIGTIPFLKDNPLLLIMLGVVLLTITGSLYKKLNKI